MKKLSFLVAAAAVAVVGLQANAEGENKMVLNKADGSTAIPIKSISRLTFDGTRMVVATADGDSQVDVLSLTNITFDLPELSVDDLVEDGSGLTVACKGGTVTATAVDDVPVSIDVYALSGMRVLNATGKGQATADLNTLPSGVYIVRVNNKTFKYTR